MAIGLAGFALDQAADGFSHYCSGWFCMSEADAGHFFGVAFEVLGGLIAAGGSIAALVLYTVPSTRLTVQVGHDTRAPRVRWVPTVGATGHGASLGLHLAF